MSVISKTYSETYNKSSNLQQLFRNLEGNSYIPF